MATQKQEILLFQDLGGHSKSRQSQPNLKTQCTEHYGYTSVAALDYNYS